MTTKSTANEYPVHADTQEHKINKIDSSAPIQWLSAGFKDFKRIPGLSLLYGALFAAATAGVFMLIMNVPWYAVAYLTGLVVLGPFLASGLYAASRDIDRGVSPSISNSVRLLAKRSTYLALFSVMLSLAMAIWIRISALILAVKFNTLSPSIEAYTGLMSSADGWITLTYFIGMGFVLVSAVFIMSAVAVPMILDKDTDFITAMHTSYRAVIQNPGPMAVWAMIIVALTAIGVATAFIGLAVIFPILGYATWHSYRSLVES
ncbi:MAG: DUF2189 domain-containing protein [Chromatiales bacterium]|jgi:uncharacterized membrane protein